MADILFDRPVLEVSLGAVQAEATDETKLKNRGWQKAAYAIYPLKINLLRIEDGTFVYREPGPFEPVEISHVNFSATNIRNVRSKERDYPSDIHLSAIVSDHADLRVDGNADFLKEPYAGFKAQFTVEKLPIAYFQPVLHHYNLKTRKGTSHSGVRSSMHRALRPSTWIEFVVENADVDFVSLAVTKDVEAVRWRQTAARSAQSVNNAQRLRLRVRRTRVANSTFGYIAASADPSYHFFLTTDELTVENLSNQPGDGTGTIELRGKFMGERPDRYDCALLSERGKSSVRVKSPDWHQPSCAR